MTEYGGHPHDAYGKHVMRKATQGAFCDSGPQVRVNLGNGSFARIDGVVCDIAIEAESRVSKQVRGALVDLLLGDYIPKSHTGCGHRVAGNVVEKQPRPSSSLGSGGLVYDIEGSKKGGSHRLQTRFR